MAQHDGNLEDQDGASFRQDANALATAIITMNSGTSFPANPQGNMIHANTLDDTIYQRNEDNTAWLPVGRLNKNGNILTTSGSPHGSATGLYAGELCVDTLNNILYIYTGTSTNWLSVLPSSIAQVGDVNITSIADNQVLQYDSLSSKWINTDTNSMGVKKLIQSVNASNAASVEFINKFTSDYSYYELDFLDIMPSSATGVNLKLQVSHDGGSSYISSASYQSFSTTTNAYSNVSYADTYLALTNTSSVAVNNPSSASDVGCTGFTNIYNPMSTSRLKQFQTQTKFYGASNGETWNYYYSQAYNSISAIDAIKISFSAGNIASGKFNLYGIV